MKAGLGNKGGNGKLMDDHINDINDYRVCTNCEVLAGPGIDVCPECKHQDFRPMRGDERNNKTWKVWSCPVLGGMPVSGFGYNVFDAPSQIKKKPTK